MLSLFVTLQLQITTLELTNILPCFSAATLIRLICICGVNYYFIKGVHFVLGVNADSRLLLPAWVFISIVRITEAARYSTLFAQQAHRPLGSRRRVPDSPRKHKRLQ